MSLNLQGIDILMKEAISHYWKTLKSQAAKQQEGDADCGGRSAVTGGKQMDGFCELVERVLLETGLRDEHIHLNRNLDLPGYFRPTKKWDMLIIHEGTLLAAIEFKSQLGPSFGNNFNNRAEEAIGTGQDFVTAYREGAFGEVFQKPWTGWLMLLEECPSSLLPVKLAEPHFPVFPEFKGASYAKRYELLLRRLVREGLYNSAAFVTATKSGGPEGRFREPATDLTMRALLAGLGGHVTAYLASK